MDNRITEPKYKRRTGTQIIKRIFEYLKQHERAKKTWLLNDSNLNSKNFERHFKFLLDTKYVEYEGDFLILTPSGKTHMENLKDKESSPVR
jgi:predicted transcriptional regulator